MWGTRWGICYCKNIDVHVILLLIQLLKDLIRKSLFCHSGLLLPVLNVSHVTHQHKKNMPYLNNNPPLSLPNIPHWHLPCDNTALEAIWCQLSAQASTLGELKELVLSKRYDKILTLNPTWGASPNSTTLA